MSDPRKNFICLKCGTVVNDTQRQFGNQTKCGYCMRKEYEEKCKSNK